MKKYIISIFVLLSLATSVYAEPTPSISYFMNESVSVFDMGMYLLGIEINKTCEEPLNEFFKDCGYKKIREDLSYFQDISAYYDWDKNRIILFFLIDNIETKLGDGLFKLLCERMLRKIQIRLGIIDGKPHFEYSGLNLFFRHHGYKKTNEKDAYYKELDNITKIIIMTNYREAECPLLGTKKDISYKTKR